jgi:hypothetical protein
MGGLRQEKSAGKVVRLPQKIHNFSTSRHRFEKAPLPAHCNNFRAKTIPAAGQIAVKRLNEPEFSLQEAERNPESR